MIILPIPFKLHTRTRAHIRWATQKSVQLDALHASAAQRDQSKMWWLTWTVYTTYGLHPRALKFLRLAPPGPTPATMPATEWGAVAESSIRRPSRSLLLTLTEPRKNLLLSLSERQWFCGGDGWGRGAAHDETESGPLKQHQVGIGRLGWVRDTW